MPPPSPLVHARSGQVALLFKQAVIPLERLAQPRLGLAGYRFDPVSGTSGVSPLVQQVELVDAGSGRPRKPALWQPADSYGLDHIAFSTDGSYLSALTDRIMSHGSQAR